MAVAPTGAIYKALEFDGVSSRTYGVYITGEAVYNAPERDVEMITIPGRNGSFALDNGRFENITVTYPAGIFAETEADFREAISEFRNFLCSRKGYVRLQDEYNPDEYRMAVYKSGLEVEPAMLKAGEFEITFDCKPQRWLTSGETAITIGEWGETETATGDIVKIDNPDGTLGIKSLSVALDPIQDLHGYDKPWSGGAGKNKFNGADVTTTHSSNWEIGWNENTNALTITHKTSYTTGVPSCSLNLPSGTYVSSFASQTKNGSISLYTNGSYTKILSDGTTFDIASGNTYEIRITADEGTPNVVTKFQIESGSTATSFEPYTNICPISGRTEVVTQRTGVNVWDEEWEQGGINVSTGGNQANLTRTRSKNYISVRPNTSYYFRIGSNGISNGLVVAEYDSEKTFIQASWKASPTVTVGTNTSFVRFATGDAYGGTYQHDISINYPSTDTEYHAYDGSTYSVSWQTEAGTVYGGEVDVVSGELVVDRAMVDLGSLTWTSLGGWRQTTISNMKYVSANTIVGNGISDKYTMRMASGFSNASVGEMAIDTSNFKVKTAGEDPSGNLVYELATPQTYQLTPQEVSLITGTNNVWSDSGDITLEYGQLPNLLINPTLFESGPLLEISGYGKIDIEGEEIDALDVPVGEIQLSEDTETFMPLANTTFPFSIDTSNILTGDSIYAKDTGRIRLGVGRKSTSTTISKATVTNTTNCVTATATISSGSTVSLNLYPNLKSGFIFGAASTITASMTVSVVYTQGTDTVVLTTSYAYDGSNTITFSYTMTGLNATYLRGETSKASWLPAFYGDSSKSAVINPRYIDLDVGEVYGYSGGVLLPLNNTVIIPAKLPTLAPGSNAISFDNTITDLKITPRWWKV